MRDSPGHVRTLLCRSIPRTVFLPRSEWRPPLDHLVDEAAEAEVVGAEGVLLVVDDLGRHVAHRAHPTPHNLLTGRSQV